MTVKGKDMLAAFGGIEEDILLRSETEKGERKKGKTFRGKTFCAIAACLIIAVGAFALLAGGALANKSPLKTPPVSDPAPYTSENKAESAGAADTTTAPDVYGGPGIDPAAAATGQEDGDGSVNTPFQTVQPGDSYSGGPETSAGVTGTQYWCVPCIPPAPGAVEVGEKITDEEAQAWLAENTWIRDSLTASGVPADRAVYSVKGYCHVKYDGDADKEQAEVRLDFRDYLLWDGDKLIAIVTLTKENGQIDGTVAFGGPWFDGFSAFLREHEGEELLFVYASFMEIVVLPDGACVNPMGLDLTLYGINEVLDDPYAYFYNENAVFVPDFTDPADRIYGGEDDGDDAPEGGGDQSGSVGHYWFIPGIPAESGAVEVGEKITDEEARAWLAENTWIRSALTASGVPADSAVYSEKGYCHVKYDGNVDKKQAEVRLDFRDYLLWDGDKLIAIVTITKENGKISGTPAFGGPGFDAFGAFLREHKGEELLFVYAKFMEIVILPDGTCVNPTGVDLTPYGINEVLDDPYAYFYNENAIFVP